MLDIKTCHTLPIQNETNPNNRGIEFRTRGFHEEEEIEMHVLIADNGIQGHDQEDIWLTPLIAVEMAQEKCMMKRKSKVKEV